MAQSTTTVTPDGPTPPTNFTAGLIGMRPPTTPGAPFLDDGVAGALTTFGAPQSGTPYEGAGTEVVVTAPGSRAECPTQSFSDLGNYTNTPNGSHASYLNGAAAATITSLAPASQASGAGNSALTVNGTGFTKLSQVLVNGVAYPTTFVNSTQLTVAAVPKKATAGTLPVTVVTAGNTTAATNWTFT